MAQQVQNQPSPVSNQNSSNIAGKKKVAKLLALVHIILAGVLTLLVIINMALIQSSQFLSFTYHQRFLGNIEKIAENSCVTTFVTLLTAAMGIFVWLSPFPKKYSVKVHLVAVSVTAAVLCTNINFSFFHMITLAKVAWGKSHDSDDPHSHYIRDSVPDKEVGTVRATVILLCLIIIVWFIQSNICFSFYYMIYGTVHSFELLAVVHVMMAILICCNFEEFIEQPPSREKSVSENKQASSPPQKEVSQPTPVEGGTPKKVLRLMLLTVCLYCLLNLFLGFRSRMKMLLKLFYYEGKKFVIIFKFLFCCFYPFTNKYVNYKVKI